VLDIWPNSSNHPFQRIEKVTVPETNIYSNMVSGKTDDRPGLDTRLKSA
jgi:hypothetical protein